MSNLYLFKIFLNSLSVIDLIVLWSAVSLCNAINCYLLHLAKIWIHWRRGLRVLNQDFFSIQKARQKVRRAIHFKLLLCALESNFCLENVLIRFDNECLTFNLLTNITLPVFTWELEIKMNSLILLFFLRRDGKSRKIVL